ncbi:hypothetical protein VDGE_30126 [Verticillium dahliae]|uniref:Uncharacterized protein n=1 Tax=Verticillium dahliae TaxID=27337 RepID=A0A444RZI9_VERDA|nr:hypothetical protein VDGE_30126 [Verticillium dahliae]
MIIVALCCGLVLTAEQSWPQAEPYWTGGKPQSGSGQGRSWLPFRSLANYLFQQQRTRLVSVYLDHGRLKSRRRGF